MKSKRIIYNVVSRYTPNKHPVSADAFWGIYIHKAVHRPFFIRIFVPILRNDNIISRNDKRKGTFRT